MKSQIELTDIAGTAPKGQMPEEETEKPVEQIEPIRSPEDEKTDETTTLVENLKSQLEETDTSALIPLRLRKSKENIRLDLVYEIPYVNAHYAAKFFCVIGLFYIGMAVVFLTFSFNLGYIIVDYTNIQQLGSNITCADAIAAYKLDEMTQCTGIVTFVVPTNITGPTYLYYGLEPYYHADRGLVEFVDRAQLLGNPLEEKTPCLKDKRNSARNENGTEIAPCGFLANYMFNDSFELQRHDSLSIEGTWLTIPLRFTDITTRAERKSFQNPKKYNLTVAFENTTKPPYWRKRIEDIAETEGEATGYENERFIVWMTTAPLPYVVKMYARVDLSYEAGALPVGRYRLRIEYNYPLWRKDAKKYLILANTAFFGHQNYKLCTYFLFVGLFCLLMSIFLYLAYLRYDLPTVQRLSEMGVKTIVNAGFTFRLKIF